MTDPREVKTQSASADGASAGRDINITAVYEGYRQSRKPMVANIRIAEFETLVADRLKRFVGREYIIKAIQNLIGAKGFESGYIVVTGEPGIGKTAIAARLLEDTGHVHHFNIGAQNIRTARQFLSSICAQVILKFDLEIDELPKEASEDSGFLSRLLQEAKNRNGGENIVIVVDALDEAEQPSDSFCNVLLLPKSLPDGVFFVVTSRPFDEGALDVDNRKDIFISSSDPQNIVDVSKFIEAELYSNSEKAETALGSLCVDKDEFVKFLSKRSEGNFMYLVHVLRDILTGSGILLEPMNLDELPTGLLGYYRRHWAKMRSGDAEYFKNVQMPIVCTLAVVQEPVTAELLRTWTKRFRDPEPTPLDVNDTLQIWKEFLSESADENLRPTYRIYHQSFQDFLRSEVGLKTYHENIVEEALSKVKFNV